MYFINFTLFLLVLTSANENTGGTALAPHPKHGWIVCNVLDGPKVKKKDPTKTLVTYDYRLPSGLSSGKFEVEPQQVIPQIQQVNLPLQGEEKVITSGMVVLGKDKKPYRVESIFANGRVALMPLDINCVSRFRLSENSCFTPKQRTNPVIGPVSDIFAVEQKCFLQTYCVGTNLTKINDIPICEYKKIEEDRPKNFGVNCGLQNYTAIKAAFSDGSLLLGTTILNVFPESTLKYQKPKELIEAEAPAVQ
jgi:hypothetical protein